MGSPPAKKQRGVCFRYLFPIVLGVLLALAATVVIILVAQPGPVAQPVVEYMWRNYVNDSSVHCNDGSRPTYYIRDTNPNNWMIYVGPGGSFCWDEANCAQRYLTQNEYMTSDSNAEFLEIDGLLSTDPAINEFFYDHSVLYIPYCSSDYWWGTADPEESGLGYYFQGSLILEAVIRENVQSGIFDTAETITVWGQGAGGYGVLTQGDLIMEYLADLGTVGEEVHMIMDSSWSAWVEPQEHFTEMNCTDAQNCQLDISASLMYDVTHPRTSPRCDRVGYECVFAGRSNLEQLSHPLMAFQWQYEISQLSTEGIFDLETDEELEFADFIRDTRMEEFGLLPDTSGYHYPACNDHEIISKDYVYVRGLVNGLSLPAAVRDWVGGRNTGRNEDSCTDVDCNPTCGAEWESTTSTAASSTSQ